MPQMPRVTRFRVYPREKTQDLPHYRQKRNASSDGWAYHETIHVGQFLRGEETHYDHPADEVQPVERVQ